MLKNGHQDQHPQVGSCPAAAGGKVCRWGQTDHQQYQSEDRQTWLGMPATQKDNCHDSHGVLCHTPCAESAELLAVLQNTSPFEVLSNHVVIVIMFSIRTSVAVNVHSVTVHFLARTLRPRVFDGSKPALAIVGLVQSFLVTMTSRYDYM